MVSLTNLMREASEKFGLGRKSEPLVTMVARALFEAQEQGLQGVYEKAKALGHENSAQNWIATDKPVRVIDEDLVIGLLGAETIGRIGRELGLANLRVKTALTFIIPELMRLFADSGKLPSEMPHVLKVLLESGHARIPPPTSRRIRTAQPPVFAFRAFNGWAIGVLCLLLTGAYLASQLWREKMVEKSPPQTVIAPQVVMPKMLDAQSSRSQARLTIRNHGGVYEYLGTINDNEVRKLIEDRMMTVWGPSKFNGSLRVMGSIESPAWLPVLDKILPLLESDGVDVRLEGRSVKVGGWLRDSERQHVLGALKAVLGSDFTYGYLMDEATEITKDSHDITMTLLSSLPIEYKGADVVQALNGWVVNFSEGGAEFPSDARDIAARAAAKLRTLSEPVVLEVAVHVDSHHHDSSDMTLTEERGNAIRDAMIKAGLPQGMLKVKPYGSLKPLAANDTPWGRFRNRRVEFRVLSVCNAANPCAGLGGEAQKAKVPVPPNPITPTVPAEAGGTGPQGSSAQKPEVSKPVVAIPHTQAPVVETEQKASPVLPSAEGGEPAAKPKAQPSAPRPVKAEDLF